MRYLRTNTAVRVTVGPFLDKTDGVTPETALTVTSCKLTLMVDDGNVPTLVLDTNPTASGGANDMVHVTGDDAGFYDLELAASNVNYLGRAILALTDAATHCPVFHEFMILPAMIYDSIVLGTDRLDTNVTHVADTAQTARDIGASVLLSSGTGTGQLLLTSGVASANAVQISGDSTAADNLETAFDDTAGAVPWTGVVDQGTAQSVTGTTVVLRAGAAFADDTLIGRGIWVFGSDQGYWQEREITDNVLSTDTVVVDAWTVTPTGTITYKIVGGTPALSTLPTVNVTQISGDSTAADNLEAAYDGTGYAHTANTYPWTPAWDAEVQSEVQDALDGTIADSVPADGTRPSISSGIYMICQGLFEGVISGTNWTIRKVDGSTTLFTVTLNDATTPTGKTRAT